GRTNLVARDSLFRPFRLSKLSWKLNFSSLGVCSHTPRNSFSLCCFCSTFFSREVRFGLTEVGNKQRFALPPQPAPLYKPVQVKIQRFRTRIVIRAPGRGDLIESLDLRGISSKGFVQTGPHNLRVGLFAHDLPYELRDCGEPKFLPVRFGFS